MTRPACLIAVAAATLFAAAAFAGDKPPTELTWDTFDRVRDFTLPTEKELGWRDIPWRNDLGRAVAEASQKEMPVLIWAMNGDPLGCT
jgi:hypothetical protein